MGSQWSCCTNPAVDGTNPGGEAPTQSAGQSGGIAPNIRSSEESKASDSSVPGEGECVVCFHTFTGRKGRGRAVFQSCGHNATCLRCAKEIFNTTKLCPICRKEMDSPAQPV